VHHRTVTTGGKPPLGLVDPFNILSKMHLIFTLRYKLQNRLPFLQSSSTNTRTSEAEEHQAGPTDRDMLTVHVDRLKIVKRKWIDMGTPRRRMDWSYRAIHS